MNDSTWIRNYNSKQTYLSVSTYPSLVCNAQSGDDTNIRFDLAGSAKGYIGYLKSYGTFLYNCASATRVYINDSGYFYTQSYINVGAGNEKNASNPPYVWGVNGSDNFMRTYATSSLNVNYATSAGSASTANYAGYSGYTLSLDNVGLPSSTSNSANTVWCKFATITFNVSAWCNTAGYLFFSGGESSDYKGILEYHFRAGQTASDLGIAQLSWITKSHDYATVIAVKTANNVYDFYTNNCSTWSTPRIYHFSAYSDRFKWNVGSWSTTKPTAALTASDTGRVYYATNAGNADTVDSQHFTYSNSSNSPTYLWATNSNGSSFLAARGSISVNYANSAGSAATLSGGSIATWGTLTAANGDTNVCTWDTGGTTGAFSLAGKGGQMSLQLDGFFYQNEGKYLVLDTNNYSSTLDSRYVNTAGDTMTGVLTMNTGTGFQMKYTSGGNDPWMYANGAPNYGIRYFEGNPDKMTLSASGNNNNTSTADLCINGNGEGTVTIRGNTIWHTGNDGSGSGLDADKLDGYHYNGLPYIPTAGGSANGTISACNSGATNPGNAAFEAREYARAGTNTTTAPHTMMYAPRIGFHWGNRYWANLVYFDSAFRFVSNDGGSYVTLQAGTIYGSSFYESSDQRLKNFHNSIDANLDKLKSIPKKYFSWKKDNENKLHIGTSAQAIRELYPELVSESDDGMLSVDYAKLSIVALKAIDVLHDEIKLLKSTNSRLEKRIQELEK
jgi:hypothetical protein